MIPFIGKQQSKLKADKVPKEERPSDKQFADGFAMLGEHDAQNFIREVEDERRRKRLHAGQKVVVDAVIAPPPWGLADEGRLYHLDPALVSPI